MHEYWRCNAAAEHGWKGSEPSWWESYGDQVRPVWRGGGAGAEAAGAGFYGKGGGAAGDM